mgnify:CR=1 FL=1
MFLKIGQTITYKAAWGAGETREATIIGLEEVSDGDKYGKNVEQLELWPDGKNAVLDLSDGHWCYGYQVTQTEKAFD